jgi:hypothetical protein
MVDQTRKGFPKSGPKNRSRNYEAVFSPPTSWLTNGEKYFPKTLRKTEVVNFSPFLAFPFHGLKKGRFMGVFST